MANKIERTGGIAKAKNRYGGGGTYLVGYEAAYAIFVHEDIKEKLRGLPRPSGIGVYWGPHGQSKYLETPARRYASKYVQIIKDGIKKGLKLKEAVKMAALELLRDSQYLVPVEFGNLRASGFV